ncbi:MAG TPA: chromate resistance protein ChrB domain-containing protein, partial [Thermoanaerobaculia bacterium]|nr:chromate resistance protein ChrB domain-containing protein [Thermoanaerobaculia bacterium]
GALALYRGRTWVTRPRPHVDRLSSAWLIRRFIDPEAAIRYGEPREGEVSFDMPGAEFGHSGSLCTFETLLAAFHLEEPALQSLAAIIHAIDLHDLADPPPELAGVKAVLDGWRAAGWSDEELESHGIALFEGLYRSLGAGTKRQTR